MPGIVAYGAYVPYYRLQRGAIGAALGSGGGKGTRAVASFDEDTTSMGVEAARIAMKAAGRHRSAGARVRDDVAAVPRQDERHRDPRRARACPSRPSAFDMVGSARSSIAAGRMGATSPVPMLAVMADIRTGLPGGADERDGGDAAVAFLFSGSMFDSRALVERRRNRRGDERVPRPLAPAR